MNHSEFNLVDKSLNGTATLLEREQLFEYYKHMQIKTLIQVLGTSFNVHGLYSQNINKVTVVSGQVGIIVPGNSKIRLSF